MSTWSNVIVNEQQGLRVSICQPDTSTKFFLDVRHTYEADAGTLPSDEGLRVKLVETKDIDSLKSAVGEILRGTTNSTTGKFTLTRRTRFLLIRLAGKEPRQMKILPVQAKFLYEALGDIATKLPDVMKANVYDDSDDMSAWDGKAL